MLKACIINGDYSTGISIVQSIWNQDQALCDVIYMLELQDCVLKNGDEYESRRWVSVVKQIIESQTWMDASHTHENRVYQGWLRNAELEPLAVKRKFRQRGVRLDDFELWDLILLSK